MSTVGMIDIYISNVKEANSRLGSTRRGDDGMKKLTDL